MPRGIVRPCGRLLGLTFYLFDGVHRGVADTNLAMAFPQRTPAERRTITREMFGHFGCALLELLKFSTLGRTTCARLIEFQGDDRARAAFARGKGVLFFTGHFGYWEINALVHALRFEPVAVLARPLDNPGLHRCSSRCARPPAHRHLSPGRGPARAARAAVRARGGHADRSAHAQPRCHLRQFLRAAGGHDVDAGGAGAADRRPVVPVFALPLPGGRYRMIYEHAVDPPDADTPDAVREFTQRCTDVLEMYVRRHPSLWLWMHRRWRDAPLPAATPGMFPPARAEETE